MAKAKAKGTTDGKASKGKAGIRKAKAKPGARAKARPAKAGAGNNPRPTGADPGAGAEAQARAQARAAERAQAKAGPEVVDRRSVSASVDVGAPDLSGEFAQAQGLGGQPTEQPPAGAPASRGIPTVEFMRKAWPMCEGMLIRTGGAHWKLGENERDMWFMSVDMAYPTFDPEAWAKPFCWIVTAMIFVPRFVKSMADALNLKGQNESGDRAGGGDDSREAG